MVRIHCIGVLGVVLMLGCQSTDDSSLLPTPVSVHDPVSIHEKNIEQKHVSDDNSTQERNPVEVSKPALPGVDVNADVLGRLRSVCRDVETPESRSKRTTDGSEKWKSKLKVVIKDFRLYSPNFKKWTLRKVDNSYKTGSVRHRGPFFGFGLTVEVTNQSNEVLKSDSVYVWATFQSKTGKRVCYAAADASRSWNPFANKGVGGWAKEKEFSEWPLRPSERKRYTITRSSCPVQMFLETDPTDVEVEVYASFRPLGADRVVTGPLITLKRPGSLLRGVPMAGSSKIQQRITRKGVTAVQALYMMGDHVLIAEDKKTLWIPADELAGNSPTSVPTTEALPATSASLTKTLGSLKLVINNWRLDSWKNLNGKIKQGHKMVRADVDISIDSGSVQTQLQAAVEAAQQNVSSLRETVSVQQTTQMTQESMLAAMKGTDGEAAAKVSVKQAKKAVKAAQKALKQGQKALKKTEKSMGGGVSSFLKTQAKGVDCGSFKLDVGRKQLKPFKGSLGKKECKQLLGGMRVNGTISFDLERWDMPFLLSWKSTGGGVDFHRVASQALGTILKE